MTYRFSDQYTKNLRPARVDIILGTKICFYRYLTHNERLEAQNDQRCVYLTLCGSELRWESLYTDMRTLFSLLFPKSRNGIDCSGFVTCHDTYSKCHLSRRIDLKLIWKKSLIGRLSSHSCNTYFRLLW